MGRYDVTASAFGYEPRAAEVTIEEDLTILQDLPLDAPDGMHLTVLPDLIDVGQVPINNTSEPSGVTLTGTGAEPVTIGAISDPGQGFALTGGTCDPLPVTLSHLESCTLEYSFSPSVRGPIEATVAVTSDAADSPHSITLRGVATTAAGIEAWVARYDGVGRGLDAGNALGMSPDGSRVFVAGRSAGLGAGGDYATVAYDAGNGEVVWEARYDGPGHQIDSAKALAVSDDGSRVFVTGLSRGTDSGNDYATVAYDAEDGAELWVSRYEGPADGADGARAVEVSPDGGTVLVTGDSQGDGTGKELRDRGLRRRVRRRGVGRPVQRSRERTGDGAGAGGGPGRGTRVRNRGQRR